MSPSFGQEKLGNVGPIDRPMPQEMPMEQAMPGDCQTCGAPVGPDGRFDPAMLMPTEENEGNESEADAVMTGDREAMEDES